MFFQKSLLDENKRLKKELEQCKADMCHLLEELKHWKQIAGEESSLRKSFQEERELLRRMVSLTCTSSSDEEDRFSSSPPPSPQDDTRAEVPIYPMLLKPSSVKPKIQTSPHVERMTLIHDAWMYEEIKESGAVHEQMFDGKTQSQFLSSWAQGDSKKERYLSSWLDFHQRKDTNSTSEYSNPRVELKSMDNDTLQGFLHLILPTLQAFRPDLLVKVYVKDFVGHSMRIVLEKRDQPMSYGGARKTRRASLGRSLTPIEEFVY